jgi:LacI family transcriptional regulator
MRWKGIRRFAKDAGLKLNPALIRDLPGTVESGSVFDGGLRLTKELLEADEKFTAILAFDDLTAYGAIRVLAEAGRSVPESCSVIGFDDIPSAALTTPGLTTIRQPMAEMGEYAASYILKHLERGAEDGVQPYGDTHMIVPKLVTRGSTAPIAKRGRGKK